MLSLTAMAEMAPDYMLILTDFNPLGNSTAAAHESQVSATCGCKMTAALRNIWERAET